MPGQLNFLMTRFRSPIKIKGGKKVQYDISRKQLEDLDQLVKEYFTTLSLPCVVLIDTAGNVIVEYNDGKMRDNIYSLAALAAGNFAAVNEIAKMIGEREFSVIFHKGENESIHFTKILDLFLLITIFGSETSLGFVRLKTNELAAKIQSILSL